MICFEQHFYSLIQEGPTELKKKKNLLLNVNYMEIVCLRKVMFSLNNTGEEQQEDSIQKNKFWCEPCLWTYAK